MKMKLLTEVSSNVKWSNMTEDGDSIYVEGVFSSAELKNNNGRIYKKSILEREVDKLMEKVANKCLWGELGHPPQPEINPDRISHLVEKLEWVGNDLMGKAKIIDTPMGKIAKTLIKEGRVGISSRGLGTVSESDSYVNEDYFLIGWDVVIDPSNQPSWLKSVTEAREFDVPWIVPETPKIIEPIIINDPVQTSISIDEARKEYTKKIWQVLKKIERSL
jgi:hypothetical protein